MAAAQTSATMRSVAEPPNMRAPRGSRALKLNSNAEYDCLILESLVSTFCTAWFTATLIGSYIVTGDPSSGLKTVTAR